MTPKMIQMFSNALQVCLANEFYDRYTLDRASKFMCIAFRHAMYAGALQEVEYIKVRLFLSRWVRWQAHLLRVSTTAMQTIDCIVRKVNELEQEEWFISGEGIAFYERLVQRLEAKAAQRSRASAVQGQAQLTQSS